MAHDDRGKEVRDAPHRGGAHGSIAEALPMPGARASSLDPQLLSSDRRYGVCEFEAPDAEAVRVAHHTAGVPFVRVWTGERFTPESMAG